MRLLSTSNLFVFSILIALFASACMTPTPVHVSDLRSQLGPPAGDEVIVLTDRGGRGEQLRVGPSTKMRFMRTDGTFTPWVVGEKLRGDEESLFMDQRTFIGDIDAVRVSGLEPREVAFLESVAPEGCMLEVDGEEKKVELKGCEGELGKWIDSYIMGVLTVWEDNRAYQTLEECCAGTSCGEGDRWRGAAIHLQCNQRMRGPRGWDFHVPGFGWVDGHSDPQLNAIVRGGISLLGGLRWADIKSVEVMRRRWQSPDKLPAKPDPPVKGTGLWTREFTPPEAGEGFGPLFDDRASRRSASQFVLSLDADSSLSREYDVAMTLAAVVRAMRVFDVGAGYTQLMVLDEGTREHAHLWFFRMGLHLDLDLKRRFALALMTDFGSGGPVDFLFRSHLGLRWHVGRGVGLGVSPFNPMLLEHDEEYTGAFGQGWSFPSRVELSVSF